MEFNADAVVYTVDDKQVGHVDRVVIDPRTREITDIVVRKGFLFKQDKVIPRRLIQSSEGDHIVLNAKAQDMEEFPDYEVTNYVMVSEKDRSDIPTSIIMAPPLYPYPPFANTLVGLDAIPQEVPPIYEKEVGLNIPEGTVAVKEGAQVISAEGKSIGKVVQVLTGRFGKHATHFLVTNGLMIKEKRLIPVSWVKDVGEDEIHLAVSSSQVDELPEYMEGEPH